MIRRRCPNTMRRTREFGYWKLETVPDHIDRIRRRGPHRMRMRRDKKKERQEDKGETRGNDWPTWDA